MVVCLLIAGLGITAGPTGATAANPAATASALREFEGKVVSINRDARVFKVRVVGKGVVRFKVKGSTRFEEGLKDFGSLREGMRVDVDARRRNGRWIAVEVERDTG
jgi:Domain of unknown function (DUF5666)